MSSETRVSLASVVSEENIIPELAARDKEGAIRELVTALASSGVIKKRAVSKVAAAIIERENLGSTGIGNGIAVPHCKLKGFNEAVGALARVPGGIDFASLDGAPTHTIFLFISPAEHPKKHIALMSRFVALMRSNDFVRFVRQTEGTKALHDFLKEVDGW
ncbi:MAG: PTS sugar transporter subunit IIA [Planctomycetota bacterium]|jgi:mannitol/fructose-specific phosphotransferase system IIA component (Ntr-type)